MYLMESETEGMRLEKKTDVRETENQLRMTGLKPGMRALDAGAGTGAVARVMARLVGPAGAVVALDASPARLEQGEALARAEGIENLRFVQGDLLAPPLEKESFDFIWSRFVFEYLSDPDVVIDRLLELLKPGGILAVGDLDGNMIFHDEMEPDMEKTMGIMFDWFRLQGYFDPHAGRRLYRRFYQKGLSDIKVQCLPYHLYAGAIPENQVDNWKSKFATIRAPAIEAIGSAQKYEEFSRYFMDFLRRQDSLTYSILFLVSGTKA